MVVAAVKTGSLIEALGHISNVANLAWERRLAQRNTLFNDPYAVGLIAALYFGVTRLGTQKTLMTSTKVALVEFTIRVCLDIVLIACKQLALT